MYQIVRIFFKGEIEAHSIEEKVTFREALQRFHTVIGTDLANNEITYCFAMLLNEHGKNMVQPFYFSTMRNEMEEEAFPFDYAVLRVRVKEGQRSTSVEFKTHEEAVRRYFNILASDLTDNTVTYNMGAVITSQGDILESRAFTSGT